MKPSIEARELLGYSWRERMQRWCDRNWFWIAPMLILFLYLLIAWFDQRDREAGLYQRIQMQQAQIDEQRHALMLKEPAYFILEARTPSEAASKLMAIATQADVKRIGALDERDRQKKEQK